MYIWINLVRRLPTRRSTRKICVSIDNWRTAATEIGAPPQLQRKNSVVPVISLSLRCVRVFFSFISDRLLLSAPQSIDHIDVHVDFGETLRYGQRSFVFDRFMSFSETLNHIFSRKYSEWASTLHAVLRLTALQKQTLRCAICDFPLCNYLKGQAISNNNWTVYYFRFYWNRFHFPHNSLIDIIWVNISTSSKSCIQHPAAK